MSKNPCWILVKLYWLENVNGYWRWGKLIGNGLFLANPSSTGADNDESELNLKKLEISY